MYNLNQLVLVCIMMQDHIAMSLFNKPKRNIRRRSFNDEGEDNENRMNIDDAQPAKIKPKKKEKPKQTLLSFGEELEEGELI